MVKTVPDWLGSLKSLRKIDLFNAQLISLPESLCHLSNLTHLDLGNNYLTELPASFFKLHNLGMRCLFVISRYVIYHFNTFNARMVEFE
jgi:hypothetical protein